LFGLTCRRVGQYLDGVEAKKGRQQKGKGRKEKGRQPPPFLSEVNSIEEKNKISMSTYTYVYVH
jgi:hypothetical protein